MVYSGCDYDRSKDVIIYWSALGFPIGYTDGIMLDCYEGIKLGSNNEILGFTFLTDDR